MLLVLAGRLCAQDFAPVGARWIYNDHDADTSLNYPRSILSVADTVLNGTTCRIVIGGCLCNANQTNYLYSLNRSVYYFDFSQNAFQLLYNFNLNAGESYVHYPALAPQDSFRVVIDSIGMEFINGDFHKIQYVHTVAFGGPLNYIFPGKIIEGIGSTGCLYPQFASCDPPTFGLRCYEDPVAGTYDTHFAPSCEATFQDSGIGIDEITYAVLSEIAPNPFSDFAFLKSGNSQTLGGRLICTDIAGRICREEGVSGSEIRIERSNLEPGLYFYTINSKEGVITGGKFIVGP